jgi:hypothetical protein
MLTGYSLPVRLAGTHLSSEYACRTVGRVNEDLTRLCLFILLLARFLSNESSCNILTPVNYYTTPSYSSYCFLVNVEC